MTPILHDVLIIGGGPAGLSAATGLARQLYTAVVFDSGVYRNARAKHMHNVPTWDHRDPADFRASARSDLLTRYSTITFSQTTISSIVRTPSGHFSATDSTGQSWTGKKLLLAVGMRDVHPDSIEGYDSVWGRGVYHCLFCDGYEDRGAESVGVLAVGEMGKVGAAVHVVRMARRLAGRVVVYTEGVEELERGLGEVFGGDGGVVVDGRRVVRLEKVEEGTEKVLVRLEDGTEVKHGFVVHRPESQVNGPFVEQLGLEMNEMGVIKTSQPFYETTVSGVFAVGDCASYVPAVVNAMAMGMFAAGGLVAQLGAE